MQNIVIEKQLSFFLKLLIVIFLMYMFFSCAQQNQPLSGGTVDTVAPKIIQATPDFYDTNFNGQNITIKFSEFIVANNINDEFFSSPPLNEKPKFKVKGRKLMINLKEPLLDSVTYTFSFGQSIVDLHESNPAKEFEYVFSTYDSIDYHQVSGKILNAYTKKPITDVPVALYAKNDDSIPFLQLPLYITKTDSSGKFTINRIRVRDYKLFAFEDLNNNLIFDNGESKLAFCDSLIKPWTEIVTIYDTLDSGTVVVNPLIDTLLDTLLYDSIVVKNITNYYPSSLNLLLFTEGSARQEVKRLVRTSKGLVKLFFVKPLINNYISISPFDLATSQYFEHKTETFANGDSVYLWFKNKEFYTPDTLKFIAKYYDIDTILIKDTISFSDYDYGTDTLPLELYSYRQAIGNNETFTVVSKNLIEQIDTAKIHLYELLDTLVADTKKQGVKVIRANYDSLVFIFDRPIVKNFKITFKDYAAQDIPVLWKTSNTNDSVFCNITSRSLHLIDTLKFDLFYDNLFFFNKIQNLNKTFELPLTYQKVIDKKRIYQDTILFTFSKNIPNNYSLSILNFNPSNYIVRKINNQLKIILSTHQIIDKDTLNVAINFVDMNKIDGDTLYFNDTLKAIYVYDHQEIVYKRRYLRSKILIGFKKQFIQTPEVELLSFNPVKKWNKLKISPTNDSILIDVLNQRVLRLNNMRLRIGYFDINQHGDTLWFSDTLSLKVEHLQNNNTKIAGREIELKLKRPVEFFITNDSSKIRNYNINAKLHDQKKYELKIDSSAFIDLYNKTHDSIKFTFEVYSPEDFVLFYIDIRNIWAVLDSVTIDTSSFYSLPNGQIILLIEDENGDLYKSANFNTDKTLKDASFLPGTYSLKLIYDENNNGYWDTGNYFKHEQPEKVFIYKTKLNLSEGNKEKIIWDLSITE